jgi:ABC-2 type transport system permease protein
VRLVAAHARAQTVGLLRHPSYSVPTLALPAVFFAFFGLPRAAGRGDVLVVSYCAYAVLSVAFFQFGVGIAQERTRTWELYLRTLPVGVPTRLAGRALSATVFAAASVGVLLALALPTTDTALPPLAWLRVAGILAAGGIGFVALGIALGYWVPPKGALPLANLLYLSLSYVGGLWTGPDGVPAAIAGVSAWLPTRAWGNLLWAAALRRPWPPGDVLELVAYLAAFAALAGWGYRRDEGQRFR